ncbi:Predicted arabinose efflux permease, MFS family [Arboricoccus pini]|uniref:Predicted arabinose efflux permease, MFS family n=1 Tax=Arboricoccus pini TaxID=1963835 RepID=A0A212RX34_9PROT|nr:YbfB/YjiJ family MFS transporter [Arboricoccus pini]SNB77349.1 Predicted arabinose efflux permease, MFS family [Arboricoccus pini]
MQANAIPFRAMAAILSALLASFLGIGLARFAYTPLVPVLISAGWFKASATAYLGAANLLGYLSGALLSRQLGRRLRPALALRGLMLLATASFFACSAPASFLWFFLWRFLSGVAGGAIMALAALAVLPEVGPERRGLAGGLIFMGVGLGIALSAMAMPFLLSQGLQFTWLTLGGVALLATLLAWFGWPADVPADATPDSDGARLSLPLHALLLEYGMIAFGIVPHILFLVDFVARGLGRGLAAGAGCWLAFGLGALAGPVLAGRLADRIGFARALRLGLGLQALAVALVTLSQRQPALYLSAVLAGAFTPGVVPLVLGRVQELTAGHAAAGSRAWRLSTIAYALGQAVAAYVFSYLFAKTGSHELLFLLGSLTLAAALLIDLAASRRSVA